MWLWHHHHAILVMWEKDSLQQLKYQLKIAIKLAQEHLLEKSGAYIILYLYKMYYTSLFVSSPDMLKDLGVNWTIVGHSERRKLFAESDEVRIGYTPGFSACSYCGHYFAKCQAA